jgi:hypothetical protein
LSENSFVAWPALVFAHPRLDAETATNWAQWATHIDHEGSLAVMQSARADAWHRLGDANKARDAAMAALKASADDGPTRLPLDRGVVLSGEFRSGPGFKRAWAFFNAVLDVDLWVVPRVMNRERLQQLVDGK